jgi:polyhydroxybutyrate depolymerase
MFLRRVAVPFVGLLVLSACGSDDQPVADQGTPTSSVDVTDPSTTKTSVAEPSATDPPATDPPVTNPPVTAAPTTDPVDAQPPPTEPPVTDPPVDLGCNTIPVGLTETTLTAGGATHDLRVYVPTSYTGESLLPVVVNWHGLGSNAGEQAVFTGYETLAETEGFMVIHPTGVPDPDSVRNSWEVFDDQDPDRDDLAFADAVFDEAVAAYCADENRIYSTGMSNGGFFTARLVCERADRIAAAVSVAATYHPDDCEPSRPVPYRAYHGTADVVVTFDGSGSVLLLDDAPSFAVEFFSQVMPVEFAEFAADAECDVDPVISQIGVEVTQYEYVGCADETPLSFFEIEGGAHTWPNTPLGEALGHTTIEVDATVDAWAFFQQHSLAD